MGECCQFGDHILHRYALCWEMTVLKDPNTLLLFSVFSGSSGSWYQSSCPLCLLGQLKGRRGPCRPQKLRKTQSIVLCQALHTESLQGYLVHLKCLEKVYCWSPSPSLSEFSLRASSWTVVLLRAYWEVFSVLTGRAYLLLSILCGRD